LPSSYRQIIKENNVTNLGFALQTCLEYEEQLERTCLPEEDSVKKIDMSTKLEIV